MLSLEWTLRIGLSFMFYITLLQSSLLSTPIFATCGNLAPGRSKAVVLLQFDSINELYKRCKCLCSSALVSASYLQYLRKATIVYCDFSGEPHFTTLLQCLEQFRS